MLELLLCALVTVLPDYLYRRYGQGKRIGHEITFYSVWFELRWGIVGCLMLTTMLITVIFYNHPSTSLTTSVFRTVPILPEAGGRVAEIHVQSGEAVEAGQPLFTIDRSEQEAAVETARRRIAEIDAAMIVAKSDLAGADGRIREAQGAYRQALDELETKGELRQRNADVVSAREIERLQNMVDGRDGALATALAAKQSVEAQVASLLPAQKASAESVLAEAEATLAKMVVRAGVAGQVEQFVLRVGDIVSPLMRPAGVLIPKDSGRRNLVAGFSQIEAQVIKVGMIAEATCVSRPFVVIPLVVTSVQEFIAAGQMGLNQELLDTQQMGQPGTITVILEPLFGGDLEGVPPGSNCLTNLYSNNHALLTSGDVGGLRAVYLHAVDALAIVHASLLRVQALMLPIRTLVFSGGH